VSLDFNVSSVDLLLRIAAHMQILQAVPSRYAYAESSSAVTPSIASAIAPQIVLKNAMIMKMKLK
jgi:hypothetical protein